MRRSLQALTLAVTLAASLALAAGAWLASRERAEQAARARFDLRLSQIARAIEGRVADYELVLRGGAALFAASQNVEREEWRQFVRALDVDAAFPGIAGIGYAPLVPGAERERFERAVRGAGLPAYAVFPPGARPRHVPVLYVEPAGAENARTLGYDMAAEPARRAALERAAARGGAALSAPLALVQDAGRSAAPGFLFYLPVYRRGAAAATPQDRQRALQGYVYTPFRAGEMLASIAGQETGLALALADVTDAPATALYESAARPAAPRFRAAEMLAVGDRAWRLEAASLPALEAGPEEDRPRLVLLAGLLVSALIAVITWALLSSRAHAQRLAGRMTDALRKSEERLALALAGSGLALFDWEVASGLVHLDKEWSTMLGGPPAAMLVPIQKLELAVHPEDRAAVQARVADLVAGRSDAYRVEHRVQCADGSWKWIESAAKATARDAGGRALRVTGTNADISARKAVEAMKNDFISSVSHELRTPLSSILASIELVQENGGAALPPQGRKFLDMARGNSERLAALVNDILDLERAESGRLRLRLEPVALAPLFERVCALNETYAARFGVRLRADAPPGLAAAGDAERLLQVLTNLVSNAAKHSPRDAEVTLTARAVGACVRIEVRDRGPGVPVAFRERLFGKFEQADPAREGTGLGLAISRAILQKMQGRIGHEDGGGEGTTFWVELPAAT